MAAQSAIQQAREHGIAISALIRAYHIGRVGEYSEMAHDAGMIGMVVAGGFDVSLGGVAPFGGARPAFGTNPISFGLPAGEQPPVLVDFATSSVAAGKINVAAAKGEPLPPGLILDREGRPSTNPADYRTGGMLLPFGGHKGYGLAVVVDHQAGRLLLGPVVAPPGEGDEIGGGDPAGVAAQVAEQGALARQGVLRRPARRVRRKQVAERVDAQSQAQLPHAACDLPRDAVLMERHAGVLERAHDLHTPLHGRHSDI